MKNKKDKWFGFCYFCGRCIVVGNKVYWENGIIDELVDHQDLIKIEEYDENYSDFEDYSLWTKKHRQEIIKKAKKLEKLKEKEAEKRTRFMDKMKKLKRSAIAKLTPEELHAITSSYV